MIPFKKMSPLSVSENRVGSFLLCFSRFLSLFLHQATPFFPGFYWMHTHLSFTQFLEFLHLEYQTLGCFDLRHLFRASSVQFLGSPCFPNYWLLRWKRLLWCAHLVHPYLLTTHSHSCQNLPYRCSSPVIFSRLLTSNTRFLPSHVSPYFYSHSSFRSLYLGTCECCEYFLRLLFVIFLCVCFCFMSYTRATIFCECV